MKEESSYRAPCLAMILRKLPKSSLHVKLHFDTSPPLCPDTFPSPLFTPLYLLRGAKPGLKPDALSCLLNA
jgi:hypothetical protein